MLHNQGNGYDVCTLCKDNKHADASHLLSKAHTKAMKAWVWASSTNAQSEAAHMWHEITACELPAVASQGYWRQSFD